MKRMKTGGGNRAENWQGSVFQEGPNPLLNYIVLVKLMAYLPVPDLRHCRLVNSSWRAAATPYLKKLSWLTCHKARSCGRLCNKEQEQDDLCFSNQKFRRDLPEVGQLGIQNFRLQNPRFPRSSALKEAVLKLLEDYGADFRNVEFPISIVPLEVLETGLPYLPNLVSLTMNFYNAIRQTTLWRFWTSSTLPRGVPSIKRICIWNYGLSTQVRASVDATNHYNSLKRLLQIAPNLEALELEMTHRIIMPNWNPGRYAIGIRQYENLYLRLLTDEGKALCPKLKDLNFGGSGWLSTWDLNLILQLDINLRQLVLRVFISDSTYTVEDVCPFIISLLERHRSSLEVLELRLRISSNIKKDDNSPPTPLRFPCCPKLRKLLVELKIRHLDHGSDGSIRFQPVDYPMQFPALKDLSLLHSHKFQLRVKSPTFDNRRIDFYNQFFPDDGQVCSTLQRLTVEVPHPNIKSSKTFPAAYLQFGWRLDLMFPNVHNHVEVKACRAMKPTDFEQFVASKSETRRMTRSMTRKLKTAICEAD